MHKIKVLSMIQVRRKSSKLDSFWDVLTMPY
jgi:hypothetical protein